MFFSSYLFEARRIAHVMEKLNIDKFHIAGNSYGGHIALEFALNFQNRLLSMTLLNNAGTKCPEETTVSISILFLSLL